MTKESNTDLQQYNDQVLTKYFLYNSLFMKLPYDKMTNIGTLLPILSQFARTGLEAGKTPKQIMKDFFERFTTIHNPDEQNAFLFKIIQYVERQVVLFDSVEDAAYKDLLPEKELFALRDMAQYAKTSGYGQSWETFLRSFSMRIVFTAHPTQFYPPAVQHILHDLKESIHNDDVHQIDVLLQQLGQTPFVNKEKPSPLDEAKSIIYYLRHVYYQAIGDMYYHLNRHLSDDENPISPELITLGFWPGGDRDGNPFVTHDITLQVAKELKTTLIKCYYNELKTLRRRITFKETYEILEALSQKLYQNIFTDIHDIRYEEIIEPLLEVKALVDQKFHQLFSEELQKLIDKVHIFKTHFATLDIRQDSRIHAGIVDELFSKYTGEAYDELTEEEKMKRLGSVNFLADSQDFEDELLRDTIENIKQIRHIQRQNGEQGCNRYIISNSEDILAVLHVQAMFLACGYKAEEIHVDIVPLFETIAGLSHAEEIMERLYTHPAYIEHLHRRNNKQTIMLGFSDGTKDGGYLKANWEIYKAKERLTAVSEKYGIKVVFFDGRGGPPARGGGKTQRFYASQGKKIANHEIQLTIQGQTITSLYGNYNQFKNNCEQLLHAGALNRLTERKETDMTPALRETMEELANISYEKYSQLKQHDKFIPYLENMSTLKYYGKANIGSRPGKRGSSKKLEFSDLRAISFVGSWSQLKQNVPGYFGIGTALQTLKNRGKFEEARKLYHESAFFKSLILNAMMSLQKSYFPLTYYMRDSVEFGEFWKVLHDEYLLTKDIVLELSGYKALMEEEATSKASIDVREEMVLPLLTIQQYALQEIAEGQGDLSVFEKMVTRSLFGNINASRNSA